MRKLILSVLILFWITFAYADILNVTQDAHVKEIDPTNNFGDNATFFVQIAVTNSVEGYILINATNVRPVAIANLSMFVITQNTNINNNIHFFYCNDPVWNETNVTWNTRRGNITNCDPSSFDFIVGTTLVTNTRKTINITNIINDDDDGVFTILVNVSQNGADGRGVTYSSNDGLNDILINFTGTVTIINSSFIDSAINFTSDGGQPCGFNGTSGGREDCGIPPSADRTPSFSFITSDSTTCKLWTTPTNFTDLDSQSPPIPNMTITGGTTHSSAIAQNLSNGTTVVFASCLNLVQTNTTDFWNISLDLSSLVGIDAAFGGDISDLFYNPNWTLGQSQVNYSDNFTMQTGNYSWNFTQFNISPHNFTTFLYNITNNGSIDERIFVSNSHDQTNYDWICVNQTQRINVTTILTELFTLAVNESQLINCTMDVYNLTQKYVNWTKTVDNINLSVNPSFSGVLI